jgi:8-oxo-dGTP diphosphatase
LRSIHVVAALIWRQGRVLLDRRSPGGRHAGLWEFPGGKRERGETDQQALARELWEELGVESKIGAEVARTDHTSDGKTITLVLYRAEIAGEPEAKEVEAIDWFELDSLESLPMPPADRPLIRAVRQVVAGQETPSAECR